MNIFGPRTRKGSNEGATLGSAKMYVDAHSNPRVLMASGNMSSDIDMGGNLVYGLP